MDQVQKPGMSTSNGGTTGFDFDEIVSNAAHLPVSSTKRYSQSLEIQV